jgi:hypothetical protein
MVTDRPSGWQAQPLQIERVHVFGLTLEEFYSILNMFNIEESLIVDATDIQ